MNSFQPDTLTTVAQDSWQELAETIRTQLRKSAELMPAMTADEIKQFVEACQDAYRLELWSASMDHEIDLNRKRTAWD